MSEKSTRICDHCGKESGESTFTFKGWLTFRDCENMSYSDGNAYVNKALNQMDFCSFACMQKWFEGGCK